jgi:hypothetical protein
MVATISEFSIMNAAQRCLEPKPEASGRSDAWCWGRIGGVTPSKDQRAGLETRRNGGQRRLRSTWPKLAILGLVRAQVQAARNKTTNFGFERAKTLRARRTRKGSSRPPQKASSSGETQQAENPSTAPTRPSAQIIRHFFQRVHNSKTNTGKVRKKTARTEHPVYSLMFTHSSPL